MSATASRGRCAATHLRAAARGRGRRHVLDRQQRQRIEGQQNMSGEGAKMGHLKNRGDGAPGKSMAKAARSKYPRPFCTPEGKRPSLAPCCGNHKVSPTSAAAEGRERHSRSEDDEEPSPIRWSRQSIKMSKRHGLSF